MSQAVIIKSNKYGIRLILDSEMEFDELLDAIAAKFQDSEKFFRDAKVAISFEGRKLTVGQEYQIIDAIKRHSEIDIICIIDHDKETEERMKAQIDAYYKTVAGHSGEFYRGTLQSGQTLESSSSIAVVGDVDPGAKIISQGSIVVLGTLNGNVHAGAAGDNSCFVAALRMDPAQMQIGDAMAKSPEKKSGFWKKRKKAKAAESYEPQIAVVKDGDIRIEPIAGNHQNDL